MFFILGLVILSFRLPAAPKLERYLEVELLRLEETYRLMDTFAEKIWPGWNNYPEVEFQVQYPNLVFLLVGPRDKIPEGYELVPGRAIRGKKIYLNRKEELPIKLSPPLVGGGGGGLKIRIQLQEAKVTPEELAKAIQEAKIKKDPAFQPMASSDGEILLYVHEFFHGFQTRAMKRQGDEKEDQDFSVNPEYSTYSNIEGLALLKAFQEKDKKKALEYFKDYSLARETKAQVHDPWGYRL